MKSYPIFVRLVIACASSFVLTILLFVLPSAALAQNGLPFQITPPADSVSFGISMESGGDMNGDHHDDIFIADWDYEDANGSPVGKFYCYSGLDGSLLWSDLPPDPGAQRISGAFAAGVGADGSDGLAVAMSQGSLAGEVRMYSGAGGHLVWTVKGEPGVFDIGNDIASIGDVNGDDIDDLVVNTSFSVDPEAIRILSGMDGSTIAQTEVLGMQMRVTSAGDLDGDHSPDFLVTLPLQPNEIRAYSGKTGDLIGTITDSGHAYEFGFWIDGGVDVTGDQVPDILVGQPSAFSSARVFLYDGKTGQQIREYALPDRNEQLFGVHVQFADVLGDGHPEIVVSSAYRTFAIEPSTGRLLHAWPSQLARENVAFGTEHAIGHINADDHEDLIEIARYIHPASINLFGGATLGLSFDPELAPQSSIISPQGTRQFTVTGAEPNSVIHLLASRSGNDCTFIPQLNMCIDLTRPILQVGTFSTDSSGTASFVLDIPQGISAGLAWLQALEVNRHGQSSATSDVMLVSIE